MRSKLAYVMLTMIIIYITIPSLNNVPEIQISVENQAMQEVEVNNCVDSLDPHRNFTLKKEILKKYKQSSGL